MYNHKNMKKSQIEKRRTYEKNERKKCKEVDRQTEEKTLLGFNAIKHFLS